MREVTAHAAAAAASLEPSNRGDGVVELSEALLKARAAFDALQRGAPGERFVAAALLDASAPLARAIREANAQVAAAPAALGASVTLHVAGDLSRLVHLLCVIARAHAGAPAPPASLAAILGAARVAFESGAASLAAARAAPGGGRAPWQLRLAASSHLCVACELTKFAVHFPQAGAAARRLLQRPAIECILRACGTVEAERWMRELPRDVVPALARNGVALDSFETTTLGWMLLAEAWVAAAPGAARPGTDGSCPPTVSEEAAAAAAALLEEPVMREAMRGYCWMAAARARRAARAPPKGVRPRWATPPRRSAARSLRRSRPSSPSSWLLRWQRCSLPRWRRRRRLRRRARCSQSWASCC